MDQGMLDDALVLKRVAYYYRQNVRYDKNPPPLDCWEVLEVLGGGEESVCSSSSS